MNIGLELKLLLIFMSVLKYFQKRPFPFNVAEHE